MKTFKEVVAVCDTISGWMDPGSLKILYGLAEKLPRNCRVLEIGVYRGKSLALWALMAAPKGGRVWGLDIFRENKQNKDCPDIDVVYKDLYKKIKNFDLIKGDSSVLTARFPLAHFDLIFIDACHDYEPVLQDIQVSLPLLKMGGVLCGHDYGHGPIKKAIKETLGETIQTSNMVWTHTKGEE